MYVHGSTVPKCQKKFESDWIESHINNKLCFVTLVVPHLSGGTITYQLVTLCILLGWVGRVWLECFSINFPTIFGVFETYYL